MPASVMKMPEATKAAMLYQQGYSQPQVAQEVGHTRKAVRTALRQLGIQTRSSADGVRARLAQAAHTPNTALSGTQKQDQP